MDLLLPVAGLVFPVALGLLAGAVRLFDDPDAAVGHLNRFALYLAFPALILVGLARPGTDLPADLATWIVVPLAAAVALLPLRPIGDRLERTGGTLALGVVFGNVAYLGLPVVDVVLGDEALALAGLIVGQHVLISLTVGPVLLLRWSGPGTASLVDAARKVVRQPLFWSPLLGLGARWLPDTVRGGITGLLGPLGASAAPVALFLLGLYAHTHRRRIAGVDGVAWAHVATKLVWLPLVTWGVVTVLGVPGRSASVLLLLSAMPPAITTFAIARDLEVGAARAAQAIVLGTACSVATIVPLAWWLRGG